MHRTDDDELARLREATPPAEEAWQLIDQATWDEGADTEAAQDLDVLREDTDAHITVAIARHIVCTPEDEEVIGVVLPHLCRCSWCRGTLHETLALCATEPAHPAYALLADAEDRARREVAERQASRATGQHPHEHGADIDCAQEPQQPHSEMTFAEILAPLQQDFEATGMTDEELGEFIDAEIKTYRAERRATDEPPHDSPSIPGENDIDAKLRKWQEQDSTALLPDIPTQTLFAQWAEEDVHMTDDERAAEDRLWEEMEEGLNEL